ncbi:MAG TPA: hypothetical protein VF702_06805 [Allosphingosinicella sp.]|jgi:hypothetical protein
MFRATLLLALLSPPEIDCPPEPKRVFLGAVATNAPAFDYRVVEVCGVLAERGRLDPRERVMYDISPISGDDYAIYVFDPARHLGADGSRICITGRPWRRDGLSREEVVARGLGTSSVTDIPLRLPDYVFYPVQCTYDGPALG